MHLRRVSVPEAQELVAEGYLLLDVRSEIEFEAGHPPNAWNIPLLHAEAGGMVENPDFLEVVRKLLPTATKLLVFCRAGYRSVTASEMLMGVGYETIAELRPGFEGRRDPFGGLAERGWRASGLPVEMEAPGRTYAELEFRAGIRV